VGIFGWGVYSENEEAPTSPCALGLLSGADPGLNRGPAIFSRRLPAELSPQCWEFQQKTAMPDLTTWYRIPDVSTDSLPVYPAGFPRQVRFEGPAEGWPGTRRSRYNPPGTITTQRGDPGAPIRVLVRFQRPFHGVSRHILGQYVACPGVENVKGDAVTRGCSSSHNRIRPGAKDVTTQSVVTSEGGNGLQLGTRQGLGHSGRRNTFAALNPE